MRSVKLRLPELDSTLPPDAGRIDVQFFADVVHKISKLTTGTSVTSRAAQERQAELKAAYLTQAPLAEIVVHRRDCRLFMHLLAGDAELEAVRPLGKKELAHVCRVAGPPTLTFLRSVMEWMFFRFDEIACLRDVCRYLELRLADIQERQTKSAFYGSLIKNRGTIFSPNGPRALARKALSSNTPLVEMLNQEGVIAPTRSRYVQVAQNEYYLESLRALPFGTTNRITKELVQPDVAKQSYRDGNLVGHEAVRILIERTIMKKVTMPEKWRNVVLSICGDPRVSRRSAKFQRWWQPMDPEHLVHMRRWLSELDLRLFLEILEEYGESTGNEGLQRMFPSRKRFLEGLYELDLVSHSRLILSNHANFALRRRMNRRDLPEYAIVNSGDTSVIYLELRSRVHLLEGTHNYSARVWNDLRIKGLADYERSAFERSTLTRNPDVGEVRHVNAQGPVWQRKLLNLLNSSPCNLGVKAQSVLTPSDYEQYKQMYGLRG